MQDTLRNPHAHMISTYSVQICAGAENAQQRTGQWMYNKLPDEVARVVTGTSFDPFHKDLSPREIYDWLDNHLIFDGYHIVGVFHNERILWEGQGPAYASDDIRRDLPPTTP